MRRRIWSVDEIEDVLLAANQASGSAVAAASPQSAERLLAYREGFRAALVSVATALGVTPLVAGDELMDARSF